MEAEEQQRIKQEPNLTFKPHINSDYQMHDPRVTVYERSQLYMRNEKQNEEIEKKKLEGKLSLTKYFQLKINKLQE